MYIYVYIVLPRDKGTNFKDSLLVGSANSEGYFGNWHFNE